MRTDLLPIFEDYSRGRQIHEETIVGPRAEENTRLEIAGN